MSGLNRKSGNLGRQLTQALREAIRAGNLKPGDLLPSTRQLAEALDIARGGGGSGCARHVSHVLGGQRPRGAGAS